MSSHTHFQPGVLQQQPRRAVNRQQQQSSGSGEFQPPHRRSLAQVAGAAEAEQPSRVEPAPKL